MFDAATIFSFIFRVKGKKLSQDFVEQFNSVGNSSKFKEKVAAIEKHDSSLSFFKIDNKLLLNNLILIDSSLPEILGEMVYLFYTSTKNTVHDLVEKMAEDNPLNFDTSANHPFYSYKIKRFLTDIALGMMPSKVWTGELKATGGYSAVKQDGEVLAHQIYHRNEFEDYLINNTKLETACSTGHEFGKVYEDDGEQFINLNLQIRFIK